MSEQVRTNVPLKSLPSPIRFAQVFGTVCVNISRCSHLTLGGG